MIGGRHKGSTSADGRQSWRQLGGKKRGRIGTPQARKRRALRVLRLFAVLLAVAAAGYGIFWIIREVREKGRDEALAVAPPSQPIERVFFDTDGVLPDAWLSRIARLKPGVKLMEADIHSLKERLESEGQVLSASVERVFPSDLKIRVTERQPVMRLVTEDGTGKREMRIVSRDGAVYQGVGYSTHTLASLPFLQPYQRPSGSYLPLAGIQRVAELLDYARQRDPKRFGTWRVVSLEHFSGDPELPGEVIEIRSALVPRIIFSASLDFGRQLDRLDYILEYVKKQGNQSIARIDLSLRDSAAVQFSSGRVGTF